MTTTTYPDGDDVDVAYNVDGTLASRTDQRGTVIEFTYNNRRQNELQKVTTLGGADNHVQSIKRAYDSLGRIEFITSYSANDGTGTIRNQVKYVYDGNNKLVIAYQSHEGAVGSTPAVIYTYDTAATSAVFTNALRPSTVIPPSGNTLTYDYGTADGIDDLLRRVKSIKVKWPDASTKTVLTYAYNGTGRIAKADYVDADVRLQYYGSSETDDNYQHLDRFGRIRTQKWEDYGGTPTAVDQFDYTHDYVGNRKTRDIPSALTDGQDQVFTYLCPCQLTRIDFLGINHSVVRVAGVFVDGVRVPASLARRWLLCAPGYGSSC